MKNDKVWDKIDASPLLQLPPEQRKALHEAGNEQFRTLWGDCFAAALTLGQPVDGGDFCRIFLKAFDFWVPKPGQTFSAWVIAAAWKVIVAPKAQGEVGSVQYKTKEIA